MKDGITEDELKELENLKAEVKRLDVKAANVYDEFGVYEEKLDLNSLEGRERDLIDSWNVR